MTGTWVLALTGLVGEAAVVSRLSAQRVPIRRVTDVVELLALAQPGLTEGILVSAHFPQMTRDVAFQIARRGMPAWGLADPGDDVADRILRDWGVATVTASATLDLADLRGAPPPAQPPPNAAVVAVTGPPGAPGRTTVAVNLAAEWSGGAVLLDADVRAPSVGFHLGLPAGSPGVTAACRRAALGQLDHATLLAAAHRLGDIAVLATDPGASHDITAAGADGLLSACSRTRMITLVDCPAPDHGPLADAVLSRASLVISVAVPTALGIRRWVDGLAQLTAVGVPVVVVWNQVRSTRQNGRLGPDPMRRLSALVQSAAPGAQVAGLRWDPRAAAAMGSSAGTLAQVAPRSGLRRGIQRLAAGLQSRSELRPGEYREHERRDIPAR